MRRYFKDILSIPLREMKNGMKYYFKPAQRLRKHRKIPVDYNGQESEKTVNG